jgi:hypothetical protein
MCCDLSNRTLSNTSHELRGVGSSLKNTVYITQLVKKFAVFMSA